MMVKITERCTMGCPHCMNNAMPDGKDMSLNVLQDTLDFLKKYDLGKSNLVLTGGEPTEHDAFDQVIQKVLQFGKETKHFSTVTVTTNGEEILKDQERFVGYVKSAKEAGFCLLFQVSADTRFYPRRIPVHKKIFRTEGFVLCDNCVEQVYPQGRALENKMPWQAKASKCFNVRAIAHQIGNGAALKDVESILQSRMKFCTPHISVDGDIKLGESDLCPRCASIYDDMDIIVQSIRGFQCFKCAHINDALPELYRRLL